MEPRVWDVGTGLPVSPLFALLEPITHAELSKDGYSLTTRSHGSAWRLWVLTPDERPWRTCCI